MNKKLNELQDGDRGVIRLLLSGVHKGVTAKGTPYLSFSLQDNTGSIEGKYWNTPENLLESYRPGMVLDIQCDVLMHNKIMQIRVHKADIVEEHVDLDEYVKTGPYTKKELQEKIEAKIASIKNETIKQIIDGVMEEVREDFYQYPAASKNHHDFVGGLATHVLQMMDLGEQIVKLYPMLDRDLLIAGILLHDIGKLVELSGAIVTEYTMEGKLLGHISIMQAKVASIAEKKGIQGEEVILLRHMILSHHGVYEYGSPVLPMLPEAEMLYLIDNIDARMNAMDKALSTIEKGDFTPRIFSLENRSFYRWK